jgi:sulfane dehydrogenase subunit SoxC
MSSNRSGRRRFLKDSALLAGIAVGGAGVGRSQGPEFEVAAALPAGARDLGPYGERSRFVTSVRKRMGRGDGFVLTPMQDSIGIITPNDLHYVSSRDAGPYTPPTEIDPNNHRLMVHGMVDRPLIFTMDELKRFPSVTRIHFIECVANTIPTQNRWDWETVQERYGKMSCAMWTGVPLSVVLKEAGLKNGASWLVAESADVVKHSMSIPIEKAMDDALLAYGQNGEPIRPQNGFPLRLVVPGWEGVRHIKWLRRIKLVDKPYLTQTESSINPRLRLDGKALWYNFEMGPKSVITFPASGGRPLNGRGYYQISGLAWSGGGAVRKVEVSTDGGRTWKDARLQDPVLRIAHTRFYMDWNWNGEEAILQSRCTDERGAVQPSLAQYSEIWGVKPNYFKTTSNVVTHFNPIQPWRVDRDGNAHNALWI